MHVSQDPRCPVCGSSDYRRRRVRDRLEMGFCTDCSLAYAHPLTRGDKDDVGAACSSITDSGYYSNITNHYAIQSSLAMAKAARMRTYWHSIIGRELRSILEIGCGTGQYYEAWTKLGVEWTGTEVNQEMLAFCRTRNIPVHALDIAEQSNSLQGRYDVIFLSQVLEHILTPYTFLRRARDLLEDDGVLHIDVPNHDSLTALYRRVNVFHKEYGFVQPYHHLIAYTKRALSHLVSHAGYRIHHINAYANNHKTFGQLLTKETIAQRLLFWASRLTRRGSLLVCVAQKAKQWDSAPDADRLDD